MKRFILFTILCAGTSLFAMEKPEAVKPRPRAVTTGSSTSKKHASLHQPDGSIDKEFFEHMLRSFKNPYGGSTVLARELKNNAELLKQMDPGTLKLYAHTYIPEVLEVVRTSSEKQERYIQDALPVINFFGPYISHSERVTYVADLRRYCDGAVSPTTKSKKSKKHTKERTSSHVLSPRVQLGIIAVREALGEKGIDPAFKMQLAMTKNADRASLPEAMRESVQQAHKKVVSGEKAFTISRPKEHSKQLLSQIDKEIRAEHMGNAYAVLKTIPQEAASKAQVIAQQQEQQRIKLEQEERSARMDMALKTLNTVPQEAAAKARERSVRLEKQQTPQEARQRIARISQQVAEGANDRNHKRFSWKSSYKAILDSRSPSSSKRQPNVQVQQKAAEISQEAMLAAQQRLQRVEQTSQEASVPRPQEPVASTSSSQEKRFSWGSTFKAIEDARKNNNAQERK